MTDEANNEVTAETPAPAESKKEKKPLVKTPKDKMKGRLKDLKKKLVELKTKDKKQAAIMQREIRGINRNLRQTLVVNRKKAAVAAKAVPPAATP